MEPKINHKKEIEKLKNQRKIYLSKKMRELNAKRKLIEAHNFKKFASIIFLKNKFKISNEFDHKGIKKFLKEKFYYLKEMDLNDSLIETKHHSKPKKRDVRTVSKKKAAKYESNAFESEIPKIPFKNSYLSNKGLFSNNSLCLKDLLDSLV